MMEINYTKRDKAIQCENILYDIKKQGYTLLKNCRASVAELVAGLGEVIKTTEVKIKLNSEALVTSAKPLSPHTDHHKADLIFWHCIEQTNQGGETLLADAKEIYSNLDMSNKRALREIYFYEHKIFPNDPNKYPMISGAWGEELFYYTYWLHDERLCPLKKNALEKFHQMSLKKLRPVKLSKNDVLIIDNKRILHGRHAITGSKNRHLRRYWITTKPK